MKGELCKVERILGKGWITEPEIFPPEENRRRWTRWQKGLTVRITLPQDLPPLRMLLVWDNLTGHYTVDQMF